MSLADYVLRKTLSTKGVQHLLWTQLRWQLVRRFDDPPCSIQAHGRWLRLPLSHELPTYLRLFPLYDLLPRRLGAFVRERYGPLKCLDVGANIGDTIACLYGGEQDLFVAVEPNPKFNRYLRENWPVPNVKILGMVCSDQTGKQVFLVDERFGTTSFHKSARGTPFETITVDDLVAATPDLAGLHLIKVDTDGNDFAVLAGAKQTLLGQPAVLFECDVFGNTRYVEDCLETLAQFRAAGYESMLVYEKFGHPLGRHELGDLTHFKELLLHQLVKQYTFFDLLLMKEADLLAFHRREKSFFLDSLPDQSLRATAAKTV